ncbi:MULTISPECIES: hypothetical protein [Aerosakkonema]|uniref:hypothetical protein n=1 Tax=Aerosakkonema TaxID=1246629 RepID=UPI0035BAB298
MTQLRDKPDCNTGNAEDVTPSKTQEQNKRNLDTIRSRGNRIIVLAAGAVSLLGVASASGVALGAVLAGAAVGVVVAGTAMILLGKEESEETA